MVTAGGVGHTGHSVLFSTLENLFDTCLLVEFLVLSSNFSWRTIDNDIGDRKQIGQTPFAVVPCWTKCSDFVFRIVRNTEDILSGQQGRNRMMALFW